MYNTNLHISPLGIKLIQGFEQCRLLAYPDSAGIMTIGWGSTRYLDGKTVKEGDTIMQAEADKLFQLTIPKFESMVYTKVKRDLLQQEFDAAVSFCYNAGTSYNAGSQWRDYNIWANITNRMAGSEMFNYWSTLAIKSGGIIQNGLIRRRKSEVTLYLTGEVNFFE